MEGEGGEKKVVAVLIFTISFSFCASFRIKVRARLCSNRMRYNLKTSFVVGWWLRRSGTCPTEVESPGAYFT